MSISPRLGNGAEMTQIILARLAITPYSVDELAGDMQAPAREVQRALKGLMSEGEVVFLESRPVEGGPFYCRPDYQEPVKLFDKDAEYVRRNFEGNYTGDDSD